MSVVRVGVGKSRIALMYFYSGLTSVSVILKPANVISLCANWNLLKFSTIPFLPHSSTKSIMRHQCVSRLSSHNAVSSTHFVFLSMSAITSSYLRRKARRRVARLDACKMIQEPKQSMRRGSSLKTSKLQDPDVELPAEMHWQVGVYLLLAKIFQSGS